MHDHKRRHGGQAVQAKRRGEEWIACTDCTTHTGRVRAAASAASRASMSDDMGAPRYTDEEPVSVWRILGLVVYAIAMFAVLVYAVPVILLALSNGGPS